MSDKAKKRPFFRRIIFFIFKLIAAFVVVSCVTVFAYSFLNPPLTPVMILRLFDNDEAKIEKTWKPYEEISPNLFRAIIAAEDARFFGHSGIDWKAVEEAKKYNERNKGKKKRGASTITMQTAKNAFLWHGRNYVRKALEAYFTVLIEAIWGKQRILEVYVNIVEWGPGIYGAEAASQKFFGKPASKLTRRQAALLAAVLPNPRRWSPARPTRYINKRASTISARMNAVHIPKEFSK